MKTCFISALKSNAGKELFGMSTKMCIRDRPYLPIEFDEVADLPETARGEGGFGSTGR